MTGAEAPSASSDPWGWLLGKSALGAWRHAPFRAVDPGQGQDPSLEPRVEVVRRLIAYPPRAFAAVIAAIAAADRDPRHPVQWVCHRSTGEAPARPYWLTFLRAKEQKGRRFYVGVELFDRDRLGLWFFSGFQEKAVPRTAWAPFPEQPRVSLPRFEITDEQMLGHAFEAWIPLAFHDALLSFELADQATAADEGQGARVDPLSKPMPPPSAGPGAGHVVDQSIVLDSIPASPKAASLPSLAGGAPTGERAVFLEPKEPPPDLRAAKARIVICIPGRPPVITPLARVTTVIGRDPRCDLVVDDQSVSSEHARITYRDGTPTIDDMGSKNGTRLASTVLKKTDAPHVLGDEVFLGLGKVGCVFVRDVEVTLLPGQERPQRHRAKLDELVARGRLPRDTAERAFAEARSRGITPGEVLLLQRAFTAEEWMGAPALPSRSGACGCVVLLFLILLTGIFSATLSGCVSFSLPPFYEQQIDEGQSMREGAREVTWDEDIGLRPVFDVRRDEKDDRTEVNWLFPLGLYERKGEDKRVHVYPFYLRDVRTDPDGFKHDTTVFFPPGLFTGSHPVHGDYAYLFPFGGTMYGLFGKDEIVGVLFPLYAWTKDRGVETNHVLFPLIAWWSGGDEKATQSGFRFLPFYGHQEKVDANGTRIFDRHTVLWPFISWVHEGKNNRNPFDSVFIFPFWGRTRSDWRDEDTVLWPLFRYMHDKKNHYEEWRAPFPFFFLGRDDGTEGAQAHTRFDIWPLFGVRSRGDSYFRQFVLWPFERYERQETDLYTDRRFWFVPFLYTMFREGKDPDHPWTARKTRVWPLVRYERKKEGDVELHALAPIWFDDPNRNFETLLDPLFRIFRYVSRHDGSGEVDVLLGLFSYRHGTQNWFYRWDVFGGLVGYGAEKRTTDTYVNKLRLFWFLDI